jgi:hypothetical protein
MRSLRRSKKGNLWWVSTEDGVEYSPHTYKSEGAVFALWARVCPI